MYIQGQSRLVTKQMRKYAMCLMIYDNNNNNKDSRYTMHCPCTVSGWLLIGVEIQYVILVIEFLLGYWCTCFEINVSARQHSTGSHGCSPQ